MNGNYGKTRRSVLKGVGAAGGVAMLGTTPAIADEGNEGGNDPCEGCGTLLTKYEWEDGEFVWEKGRDSLGIDGDEFDLSITDTNDDGEPLCFEFDSIDNRGGVGIYEGTCLTVKAGQGEEQVDLGGWTSDYEYCVPDKYAISNFALCIDEAMWQMDFGTGDPPLLNTEDPATREGYGENSGRDLIRAAVHGPPNRDENFSFTNDVDGVDVISSAFELSDEDGNSVTNDPPSSDATEAELTFEVTASEALELHLGVWEMPGPYDKDDIPWGPRYDLVHDTFDPGEHTIAVDVPSV